MNKLTAIDLFSGAGGWTLGLANAGIDVIGHVEKDEMCLKTYECNKERGKFQNSELICKDITKITDDEVLAFKKRKGHINLIVGSPPCQSFSTVGKREIGDPKDNLFLHFVRFVNLIRPDCFFLENVPGMLSKKNDKGELMMNLIIEAFKQTGYEVEYALMQCSNYGVPQNRRRVIIAGAHKKEKILFPLPTHFDKKEGTKEYPGNGFSKCSCCEKYYASYVIRGESKKCIFCHTHEKNKDKSFQEHQFKVGFIVVPKKVKVPASYKEMIRIRFLETRFDLTGKTTFAYCDYFEWGLPKAPLGVRWFKTTDLRLLADNDEECDNAEAFMYNHIFNVPKAISEMMQ